MRLLLLMVFCLSSCHCEKEEEWVMLSPEQWTPLQFGGHGATEWEEGTLHLDLGVELTGVRYEGPLPEMPYELELEARKITGSDFFCGLTFPVSSPDECLTLILGGWGGGVVGLSSIDRHDASQNETTSYRNFERNRWYHVKMRVTEHQIMTWIDGEGVIFFDSTGHSLGLRPGVIELCAPLGLATWQTEAEIRKVRWRSLAD